MLKNTIETFNGLKTDTLGIVTVTGTGVTGIAQAMAWIPNDIGKLACLVAILSSLVIMAKASFKTRNLIQLHRLGGIEEEKAALELEEIKRQYEEAKLKRDGVHETPPPSEDHGSKQCTTTDEGQ